MFSCKVLFWLKIKLKRNHVAHRHAVDRSQLLSDGEDVQQGLSGMFPDTVASIDQRLTALTGRALRRRSHVHKILKTHLQTKQASKHTQQGAAAVTFMTN